MEIGEARRRTRKDLHTRAEKLYLEEPSEFQKEPVASVRNLLYELAGELSWLEKQYDSLSAARASLEERVAHYLNLLDSSPIALIYLDLEHTILGANLFAAQMLGVSRPNLINLPFSDFLTPSGLDVFNVCCGQLDRKGIVQSAELEMRKEDGSTFWAGIEMTRIPTKAGGIYLLFALDITRRKSTEQALEQSERRFRSTLDNMREGCIIIDHDFRYLYANEASVRFARRTREQRLGHTMMEVLPGFEKTEAFARLKRCMDGRVPDEYEVEYTFPEGITAWFEVRCEPVPEGLLVLYLDITERKQKALAGVSR